LLIEKHQDLDFLIKTGLLFNFDIIITFLERNIMNSKWNEDYSQPVSKKLKRLQNQALPKLKEHKQMYYGKKILFWMKYRDIFSWLYICISSIYLLFGVFTTPNSTIFFIQLIIWIICFIIIGIIFHLIDTRVCIEYDKLHRKKKITSWSYRTLQKIKQNKKFIF